MPITAKLKYLRIAPRKVRLVADLVRGKKAEEAQTILSFTTKKGAEPILKLLKSAIANAKNNSQLEESNLFISKITVDEGPKLKRWMPRARGQAALIMKRSSHILIVLDEIEHRKKKKKIVKEKKRVPKTEAEIKKPEGETKKEKEEASKEEQTVSERPKKQMRLEQEKKKPKFVGGIKRIFRRKAF